ncbi:metal-dependent hydrolase [Natrinema sp. 74]|uniref:metal-dependent hydrolase n=1 Tax=Natrinema sp. 74 TaxID=3384159 RepID=UPI0038D425DF
MMTPNHATAGLLLALTATRWHPELLSVVAVTAFIGGVVPDLDTKLEHRKTLHYPAYYSIFTGLFLLAATVVGAQVLVVGTYFFAAATLHCYTDLFVDVEKTSDEPDGDGIIFVHPIDRWVGPVMLVRYAGSPEDLLVGLLLAVLPLLKYEGIPFALTVIAVAWSVLYFGERQYRRHMTETSDPSEMRLPGE